MIGNMVKTAVEIGGRWVDNPNVILALELAAQGWHVIPMAVTEFGKIPAIPHAHKKDDPLYHKCPGDCGKLGHGFNDATTDVSLIEKWFCSQYPDAVIGVNCARSGIICLDFDKPGPAHPKAIDGVKSFQAYARGENSKFITPIQTTPNGGYHVIFKAPVMPEGARIPGSLTGGVDVKYNGGFCTGILPDGRAYKWVEHREFFIDVQDFPHWIIRRIVDDERLKAAKFANNPSKPVEGNRPGDDYRNRHTWAEVLAECLPGWFIDGERVYREDKSRGVKATLRDDVFYIFTESGLPGNVKSRTGYNKFSLFVDAMHNGNYKSAAKELHSKGYGKQDETGVQE